MSLLDDNEVNNIIIVIKENNKIHSEIIENKQLDILYYFNKLYNKIIFLIIFIITFPIFFCDIYYSIKNINCLSNILYNYLLWSGILSTILLYSNLIFKLLISNEFKLKNICTCIIFLIIELFSKLFYIIGTLFLIIEYFNTKNKILCNSNVSFYIFVSCIIKIIFIFIIIFFTYQSKNDIDF